MKDFIKKLLRESFNITNKTKDILDDITDEKIDQAGRTIVVEVKIGVSTVGAANELRKLM